MLKVGLTGNIAAGKSTVASAWRELGATVVDADDLSRQAVEPGTPAHAAIAAEWGTWVLEEGGGLDRAALRQIVFADPDARARLESIVHPAVAALRDDHFRDAADRGEPLVVADVPLLFEVGMADEFDVVVLVDAPEETRLMRLVGDRGLEPEEARKMMAAQMPAELKRARADVVIENTRSLGDLQRRAREVWEGLVRRAEARG
ncbi:MAG: Dephospho-CoA kinase [uncultured Gemmatimonadetes bacterium]|uniref:Dephospho-CoA kinase n=1 Tax=uncultured Gemmatimonadota bacterium TaxID=203437 RepID=A0A6J4M2C1_9BACT|nr:MAG: Dephospho-CoA kinase [uncultured Gemmatimonadota bacterium]